MRKSCAFILCVCLLIIHPVTQFVTLFISLISFVWRKYRVVFGWLGWIASKTKTLSIYYLTQNTPNNHWTLPVFCGWILFNKWRLWFYNLFWCVCVCVRLFSSPVRLCVRSLVRSFYSFACLLDSHRPLDCLCADMSKYAFIWALFMHTVRPTIYIVCAAYENRTEWDNTDGNNNNKMSNRMHLKAIRE